MLARTRTDQANDGLAEAAPVSMPGGKLPPQPETPLSRLARDLDLHWPVWRMCVDPVFYAAFVAAVPDAERQLKYLQNTSEYLFNRAHDPEFVLLFRRTLPSAARKPEAHWTSDFCTAVNGLTWEIPEGPHRFHSVILCATLAEILKEGGYAEQNDAGSDGEVKVISRSLDHASALTVFKPDHEIERLREYMTQPGALNAEQVLEKLLQQRSGQNYRNQDPLP